MSLCEIVEKEKEIRASFVVTPQTVKVMVHSTIVHNECLIKMEKVLHLWMKDMNRKHSDQCSMLLQKALTKLL